LGRVRTLPNGAQLANTTNDAQLITAMHQWFGAQISDHGHDAIDHLRTTATRI